MEIEIKGRKKRNTNGKERNGGTERDRQRRKKRDKERKRVGERRKKDVLQSRVVFCRETPHGIFEISLSLTLG